MNYVKLFFFAEDLIQHDHMMGQVVHTVRIQSQSSFAGWDQAGSG
jgi:hypothetical protein